ncbi:hypothetical protein RJ639_020780, partial [Escallonia herrerae]
AACSTTNPAQSTSTPEATCSTANPAQSTSTPQAAQSTTHPAQPTDATYRWKHASDSTYTRAAANTAVRDEVLLIAEASSAAMPRCPRHILGRWKHPSNSTDSSTAANTTVRYEILLIAEAGSTARPRCARHILGVGVASFGNNSSILSEVQDPLYFGYLSEEKMASLKVTVKCTAAAATGAKGVWNHRSLVSAARPLQKVSLTFASLLIAMFNFPAPLQYYLLAMAKSDNEETCQKVDKAADAVTETAKQVSKTAEVVTGKVSEVADSLKGQGADSIIKVAADKIKEKIRSCLPCHTDGCGQVGPALKSVQKLERGISTRVTKKRSSTNTAKPKSESKPQPEAKPGNYKLITIFLMAFVPC